VGIIGLVLGLGAVWLAAEYWEKVSRLPTMRAGPIHRTIAAADTMRFLVIGDSGSGNRDQKMVANAMEGRCRGVGVDGIIHVGDVFYVTGVKSVDDPKWQSRVFGPYGNACLKDAPIYSVFGNHDYSGNTNVEIQVARENTRWVKPYRFYDILFGDLVHVIAFDAWFPDFCFDPSKCAIDFLLDSMERHDAHWRIVFGHYPMSSGSARTFTGLRGWLLRRLLCTKDVDLYLAGHDHHLEYRTLDDCNPSLIISGAGGGELYGIDQ
jgi:acid phosphatase